MNPYIAKLRSLGFKKPATSGTFKTLKTGSQVGFEGFEGDKTKRISENRSHDGAPYVVVLAILRERCPDHIDLHDWQLAIEDACRFLAQWGEQAELLGWTARDLFGLAPVLAKPTPSYRRLSRYDLTGLIWLLRGRPVVALTEATAAIQQRTWQHHRLPPPKQASPRPPGR